VRRSRSIREESDDADELLAAFGSLKDASNFP
jgi:hypothetical protein